MYFTCQCGSQDFHVFMRYLSVDKERFRCKECKRTYQRDHNKIKEIDLMKMWLEGIKHI